jgi:hypothetical protein
LEIVIGSGFVDPTSIKGSEEDTDGADYSHTLVFGEHTGVAVVGQDSAIVGVCEREGLSFTGIEVTTDDRLSVRYGFGDRGNSDCVVECVKCRLQVRVGLDTSLKFIFHFGNGTDTDEVGDKVNTIDGCEV